MGSAMETLRPWILARLVDLAIGMGLALLFGRSDRRKLVRVVIPVVAVLLTRQWLARRDAAARVRLHTPPSGDQGDGGSP